MRVRILAALWLLSAIYWTPVSLGEEPDPGCDIGAADNCVVSPSPVLATLKDYVTAPVHWSGDEWLAFGGLAAAVGVAHHFDARVRADFNHGPPGSLGKTSSYAVQDALPAASVFAGTWVYANVIGDDAGRREAWTMLEGGAFASVTAFALEKAIGRKGPGQTTDPNQWRSGGASFPSTHVSAAFGICTVLAESGSDKYRWVRRALGYGVGAFTAYERLKHNQHWLSDTVGGAGVGAAAAVFSMNHNEGSERRGSLGWMPIDHGAMLTYNAVLH